MQNGSQKSRTFHTQALAVGFRHDLQVGFRLRCLYTGFRRFHESRAGIDTRFNNAVLFGENMKVHNIAVWAEHLTKSETRTKAKVQEVTI